MCQKQIVTSAQRLSLPLLALPRVLQGAFLARCEEEASSRRKGVSLEDMMPPSYSDDDEFGNSSEIDSENGLGEKGGDWWKSRLTFLFLTWKS